jgi:hypothetical protein
MEDYRVENEDQEQNKNQVTNEKPPTAAGKPKKKVKKVNVKVSDHAANGDQVDNPAVEEKSGNNLGDTLFILDLMRQRKEKLMRQKKDEKINEMAMKQKQQKLEARQGMRVLTRPSFGGFVGVGAILANSRCTSPAPRRRTTPKPQEPEVNIPGPDNTEMLIMGILRDKKEEKYHEAHNVRMEQAGVPSDDRYLDKFDH